jgi:hypothetical protein
MTPPDPLTPERVAEAVEQLTRKLIQSSPKHMFAPAPDDVRALLAEVERLTRERDEVGLSLKDEVTTRLDAEAERDAALSRIAKLEELTAKLLSYDREAFAEHRRMGGLADSIDNDGKPYQSQSLGDLLEGFARAVRGGGEEEGNGLSSAKTAARPNALPPASEVAGGGEP